MQIADPTGKACPYRMRACVGENCPLFVRVLGTDPNTGEQLNQGACAPALTPLMLLEMSQKLDGVQQATESGRNENVNAIYRLGQALNSVFSTDIAPRRLS
jgi:hypothetical protein